MTEVDVDDFNQEKRCVYKGEHYSVRDNGAVFKHKRKGKRIRPTDHKWKFGKENSAINEDFLAPLQQGMEKRGIVYHPVFAESYLAEELANYVEKRRDLLCVILDTEKLEERQCQAEKAETKQCTTIKQKIEKELQKLKCPVVVYGRPLRV